jgi:ATP-dependent helicase/nuclease subunit B
MTAHTPRVCTISPDKPFLEILARAVLDGFPRADGVKPGPLDLARWTILLPTRRAVRELENVFFRITGGAGLLLPKIKPIGDIDEDLLVPVDVAGQPETPVSPPGQMLLLVDLIDDWAKAHPNTRLAQEISSAPHQANGLALSLAELLDSLETEEIDVAKIPELYGIESARHREAILEFLSIAREIYPGRLKQQSAIGPQARRSQILRREAARLAASNTELPFIAAGSTGSISATCELLKSIAHLANGAVVLPGLDQVMDEPSWLAVGPTHPQYALKQLLQNLNVSRADAVELGDEEPGPRRWLASELMRPADTAHLWRENLQGRAAAVTAAMSGVELVETRSIPEQALTAALILRECLETPGKTGCLVTPDRQLARRVKTELRRWNIAIDDSAGEPLIRYGGASLLNLLIETLLQNFAAEPLAALLRHDLAAFGEPIEQARKAASLIELALLRTGTGAPDIAFLSHALRLAKESKDYKHLLFRQVTAEQWEGAASQAARISTILIPLQKDQPGTLEDHLDRLGQACEAIAGEAFWLGEGGDVLRDAFDVLRDESRFLRNCDFIRAAAIIRHWLHSLPVRRTTHDPTPLSILGLLEARLIRADVMVMAGLNEGIWPGAPDCGPWINRPMRDILAMKQPEAQIGQTAHDFVQAFGCNDVKLLWSRRIGDSPATPSRWIHRLQMILNASNLKHLGGALSIWPVLAQKMVDPGTIVTPIGMPKPRPPVELRPKQLSVTRIGTLVRDPYAIYARHILRLEPVNPIAALPDPARRGIIFHAAIGDFMSAFPKDLPAGAAAKMLVHGSHHFEQIADYPGLVSFWWPRFVRVANWIAEQEKDLRAGVERTFAELSGEMSFDIAGAPFTLTCRADRIDVFADGHARIVDYKTGKPPSTKQVDLGLEPQLTLQAAILEAGGFRSIGKRQTDKLLYIQLGGGDPPGELLPVDLSSVMDVAHKHLDGLKRILGRYANPSQPYFPRAMMEKDEDESDYDHLSRFREWTLSGDRP